ESGFYSIFSYPVGALEFSKSGYVKWIEAVRSRPEINVSLTKESPTGVTLFTIKTVIQSCQTGGLASKYQVVEIRDFGQGIGNFTLTADKLWVLKNRVFVNEGQTLTIEPGTIIKAGTGQVETACALVVARGGKLIAKGTAAQPIIFTSEDDPVMNDKFGAECLPTSLKAKDKGRWGGVILLGKATINAPGGETYVDGIPTTEPRAIFGGTDDDDNSGTLEYVSIRHGGISLAIGNQINGLTLGGVGRGTTLHHVEVYANAYDGFRFIGGTVNTKYLTSSFCGDDAFDYTGGWRGNNQYWFAMQDVDADRGVEGTSSEDKTALPASRPVIFNATFSGPGSDTGKRALSFFDNGGGEWHNSIFMAYAFGADIEFKGQTETDSYQRMVTKELELQRNILFDVSFQPWFALNNQSALSNSSTAVLQASNFVEEYFNRSENANRFEDPQLIDLVPKPGGPAAKQGSIPEDPFIEFTEYKGSFAPAQTRWTDGWTRVEKDI
ncbi:MAG: hypothetical protein AAB316_11360, partial [Bacteroidota bacterium]